MHPNLFDQLVVFETITELGSFSAAARKLNRTVSAITYAVTQLEEQLGFALFDRSGYRPELTTDGQSLLRDTHIILRKVERFESRVSAIKSDEPVNITLAVDPFFPIQPLANALAIFSRRYPHVQVSIQHRPTEMIPDMLKNGEAELALVFLYDAGTLQGLDGRQILTEQTLLVTAKDHPLAQLIEPFPLAELDNYRQVIFTYQPIDAFAYDFSVHVTNLWAVSNIQMMKKLVSQGVGWAYMQRDVVEAELASGELVTPTCRDLPDWPVMRFAASWATKRSPNALLEELIDLVCAEQGRS